jgi:hypothetical protein
MWSSSEVIAVLRSHGYIRGGSRVIEALWRPFCLSASAFSSIFKSWKVNSSLAC